MIAVRFRKFSLSLGICFFFFYIDPEFGFTRILLMIIHEHCSNLHGKSPRVLLSSITKYWHHLTTIFEKICPKSQLESSHYCNLRVLVNSCHRKIENCTIMACKHIVRRYIRNNGLCLFEENCCTTLKNKHP